MTNTSRLISKVGPLRAPQLRHQTDAAAAAITPYRPMADNGPSGPIPGLSIVNSHDKASA